MTLQSLGIEAFLPLARQIKRMRRGSEIRTPLFPGYLFSRFNYSKQFRAVSYARGVKQIVSFGTVPAKVDDQIILSIQEQLDAVVRLPQRQHLAHGQLVKIHEGPMRGLEAVFDRETCGHQRAVLLLKALAYQARVVIPFEHLDKCAGF